MAYYLSKKNAYSPKSVYSVSPFYIKYSSFIISIAIVVLFILFFDTNRLVEESNIFNVWSKPINTTDSSISDPNLVIGGNFKLNFGYEQGKYLHYFDELGNTIFYTNLSLEGRVSVGNSNFINYRRLGRANEAYGINGNILWITNTSVYPEVSKYSTTIINHSSDNSIIQMLDWNNNVLSEPIQYGEFVTDGAFADNTGDYVAGFSSGYIALINRAGELDFAMTTILSEINFVKAVGISEDGSFIASLSGIRPEYLTLYKKDGETIWYTDTEINRRRNVSLGVSEKSMMVYMPTENTIDIYSIPTGKIIDRLDITKYGMDNPVYMKSASSEKDTIFAIAKDGRSVVLIYEHKTKEIVFTKEINTWVYNVDMSDVYGEYLIVSDKYIYSYKKVVL